MMKLRRIHETDQERLYRTPRIGGVWFGIGIAFIFVGSNLLLAGVSGELNCRRSETQVDCQPISSVILNQPLTLGGSVVLSIGLITGAVSTLIPQRSLRLNRSTQQLVITRRFGLLPISKTYPSSVVQTLSRVQESREDGTTCFKAVLPIGDSSLTLTEGSRYAVADLIAEIQGFLGFPVQTDEAEQRPYRGLAVQTNPVGVSQAEFRSDSQNLAVPRQTEARALYQKLKLKHKPMALALSPDERYLAAGFGRFDEGRLRVWQVSSQMLLTDIYHSEQVTSVLFSPDSHYVLYCSDCAGAMNHPQIGVYDITQTTSRKELQPSVSAINAVRCFAISPDGRVVAVVQARSDQTKIRLVDFESGDVLDCLTAQQPVQRVAFLPDGRSLLTVSSSQSVDIWQ